MCMEPDAVRGTDIYTFQSTPLTYAEARDFCRDDTGFGLLPSTSVMRFVGFSPWTSANCLVEPWVNTLAPLPSRNDGDNGCMLLSFMSFL